MLTELEKRAPILGRLRDEQAEKLAQWLAEKIERLMAWGLLGIDEQRYHVLGRLIKLQEGIGMPIPCQAEPLSSNSTPFVQNIIDCTRTNQQFRYHRQ